MISDDIFIQLANKPYLCVPFLIARAELENAMASFLQFLALPSEIKQYIALKIAPRHRRGDAHYMKMMLDNAPA